MSSFSGNFTRVPSRSGGIMIYSFALKCTNWLQSETIDFMLSDAQNIQPQYYRGQTIKAGSTFTFNYDTCGWQWCQGDFFAILKKNGRIDQSWQLNLKEYAPGECPECHGTNKCKHCKGQGFWVDLGMRSYSGVETCPYCGGTGVCGTCNIPRRSFMSAPQNVGFNSGSSNGSLFHRHRPIADIKQDIQSVQSQLERLEWNYRMNKVNGLYDEHSYILNKNEIDLLSSYRRRLIDLQEELRRAMS